ncbi:aromatic ring-hydroxylating dioxygenase subunit alpha [Caballeronia sp. LjRoot34]|uniref:aromatic ring-hydroxylating oxygenase subunit alpha n=1 Tax=Caballeronia sp. LjRoot34 TaxID=3342325 RepID=UPI003ED00A73
MNDDVINQIFTEDQVDSLRRDTANALGLPPEAYYADEIFEFEREHIFKKRWLAAGYASTLPEAGSTLPFTLAGYELVLVRGADQTVRCFHNICKHRGTKVVMEPGTFRTLSCPWHAWTYGLDGKLKATPNVGGQGVHSIVEIDKASHGLTEVKCVEWNDILFVDIGGQAVPFGQYVAPIEDALSEFDMSLLEYGASGRNFVAEANWKIVIESGIEGYHLPVIHPTLRQPPKYDYFVGADTFIRQSQDVVNYKNSALGGTLGTSADSPRFERFPNMRKNWDEDGTLPLIHFYCPPTLQIAVMADMIAFTLFNPISPTKTASNLRYYFIGDSAHDQGLTELRRSVVDSMDDITQEDMAVMENAQGNLKLRRELNIPTRFSPYWEGGVHRFQKFYLNMFR